MNLKRVLRADEEGVQEGYRDEQEESDEVHCSGQHPQTFGTVRVRQRSDHTTVKSTVILVKSIAKFIQNSSVTLFHGMEKKTTYFYMLHHGW